MCETCRRGQSDYGHGVRIGQERESNDRDADRASHDPHYTGHGGRVSYDKGRGEDYVRGVEQGRENVRRSRG